MRCSEQPRCLLFHVYFSLDISFALRLALPGCRSAWSLGHMEIAGSTCNICKRHVTFAIDGKFCPNCRVVVHHLCEPRDACGDCGQSFEKYERPITDPTQDAVLPRALRAPSAGPAFVALAMAVVALLVIVGYYTLMYALSHGH